jgi:hypothetical protein
LTEIVTTLNWLTLYLRLKPFLAGTMFVEEEEEEAEVIKGRQLKL